MTEETPNWPPKTCEMPELPKDYGETIILFLNSVIFVNCGRSDYAAASYSKIFIRLCDLAIQEYNLARESLISHVSSPNMVMSHLFVATGHLEQCINAMRRALRFARHQNGLKLPRTEVISSRVENRIINLRGAIEHTDERIRDKVIQEGEFFMLAVKSNAIELDGKEILFSELAEWLKQLQELAEKVATYKEASDLTTG